MSFPLIKTALSLSILAQAVFASDSSSSAPENAGALSVEGVFALGCILGAIGLCVGIPVTIMYYKCCANNGEKTPLFNSKRVNDPQFNL